MKKIKFLNSDNQIQINNIFCIGRNYAEHAKELNNSVPKKPLIFTKPNSAITLNNTEIFIPNDSESVHHEVEVVVAIGKSGKNISIEDAHTYIAGYSVGIDVTARDIQSVAKSKGHPWAVAKGYDTFAVVGDFITSDQIIDPQNIDVSLHINGELRQIGNTIDMIFPILYLISYLSNIFTLNIGDLIYTGTPEGVGELKSGDQLIANLHNGLSKLQVGVK